MNAGCANFVAIDSFRAPGPDELSVSRVGLHVDELAALFACGEHDYAVNESEERVVLTHAHVEARVVLSATLTLDDIAGFAFRSTEDFHAEAFAF